MYHLYISLVLKLKQDKGVQLPYIYFPETLYESIHLSNFVFSSFSWLMRVVYSILFLTLHQSGFEFIMGFYLIIINL